MTVLADVVVIGLGAVGSATLRSLAKHGVRAIGIDRFYPPHDRGSTHGESRITRLGVGEGHAYA
jgi:sarcosine oxidase